MQKKVNYQSLLANDDGMSTIEYSMVSSGYRIMGV